MIQKIKKYLTLAAVALTLLTPTLVPAFGGVASAGIKDNLCKGANDASGETTTCDSTGNNAEGGLKQLAETVTRYFSIIVGAISIIMIIFGGFRYITSGGDSGKVGNAKNTLIYALIGLVIVVLAQVIVRVVVDQAGKTTNDFTSGSSTGTGGSGSGGSGSAGP